jgi:hypothetical protein
MTPFIKVSWFINVSKTLDGFWSEKYGNPASRAGSAVLELGQKRSG